MTYDIKLRKHVLKVRERDKLSLSEAGLRFGVNRQTVYNWTKRLEGKTRRHKQATKIDMEALSVDVKRYPDGYQYERAKRLGVSIRCVGYALLRLGVSYKKNTESSQSGQRRTICLLPQASSLSG